MKHADQLRDKHYLLVHGTADDNVHFQQSMLLAKSLASNGVLFKQQIYPDEGHSMLGVQRHLYRSMTTFFEDCFRRQVNLLKAISMPCNITIRSEGRDQMR